MSMKPTTTLVDEFKSLIHDLTTEVSGHTVIQEIKSSERILQKASTNLPEVSDKLQAVATQLQSMITELEATLQSIDERVEQVDEGLTHTTSQLLSCLKDSHREYMEQLYKVQSAISDKLDKEIEVLELSLDSELNALKTMHKENGENHKRFQTRVYWLLGIQMVLIIGGIAARYIL